MTDALARFRALQKPINLGNIQTDTTSDLIAQNAESISQRQNEINAYLENVRKANESVSSNEMAAEGTTEAPSYDLNAPMVSQSSAQGSILPGKAPLTQTFGNRSSIEAFSKGVNLGADFGVKRGTPMALPPGEWEVMTTFSGAKEGQRNANKGSGNLVKVINSRTGEMLTFEHLSGVAVKPGQKISGGTVVGLSGNTGNSTGPHASIPYQDPSGKYHDIMSSPYGKYLFGNNS